MKLIDFQKITAILAKEHKINIKEGPRWASNIIDREVYYKKNDIYDLPEDHTLGLLLHEIAHIHYTTNVPEPPKNKELMKITLNMVEDNSIEHIIGKDYTNAAEILQTTKTEVLDTLIGILPKIPNPIHEKALYYAAIRFEDRGYATHIEKYEIVGNKIAELMKAEKTLIYKRKQTKNLMPLCTKIVELLIKELGDLTEEEKKQIAKENIHGQGITKEENNNIKRQIINQLKAGKGWQGMHISEDIKFIDEIAEQALIIGKKLRSILKRNNAMEFGGRYRTGKLKTKKIAKIKILKDRKPFSRKIIKSNQSYSFAIATDVSGSMFDENPTHTRNGDYALSSLYMIGEALRMAHIPRSLIIFGEHATAIAPMGKTMIRWESLSNEKILTKTDQGNTNIDQAIKLGTLELNKTRTERKILIILTDGHSDKQKMETEHAKAIKQNIECIGITIGNNNDSMNEVFGKKNKIIPNTKDSKEIGKAFIDILKTSITLSP